MAGVPVALVVATAWLARRRFDWPRPTRQLAALGGCLALVAVCVTPAIYFNHKNERFWGLTNYLGINLYARVVDYDNVHDPDGPAMKRIMDIWEKHAAHDCPASDNAAPEETPGQPGWRYHWSCMFLLLGEGGLSRMEADRLMKSAALEGIRKDTTGYVIRTFKNLVAVLAAEQGLPRYTDPEPPPLEYPKNYFIPGRSYSLSPYRFNKASLGCAQDEAYY